MRAFNRGFVLGSLALALAVLACNLPSAVSAPAAPIEASPFATDTQAPLPPQAPEATPTPSATPAASPTPENPFVSQVALCWTGPGKAYPVVSSVKAGTQVELMGVGSLAGWFIIRNPTYHDACWIEAKVVTIGPGYDVSQLKIYNPPPTPGPSATPRPTETP